MGKRAEVYDRLKSQKKPVKRHIDLCLDSDVALAHDDALSALRAAEVAHGADKNAATRRALTAARRVEEKARLERDEVSQRFKFQSISQGRYVKLVDKHPPTAEQRDEFEVAGLNPPDLNPLTFAPAIVAACIVEPDLDADAIADMWSSEDWSAAELELLFHAANGVNAQSRVVELGKGSGSGPA